MTGFSWKFHVKSCRKSKTVWSNLTPNSMSFIQVLFVRHAETWHGFWTSSSHGISTAFSKKMMGFPSDLMSFSTKLSSKRHEKILSIFLQGTSEKTESIFGFCVFLVGFALFLGVSLIGGLSVKAVKKSLISFCFVLS